MSWCIQTKTIELRDRNSGSVSIANGEMVHANTSMSMPMQWVRDFSFSSFPSYSSLLSLCPLLLLFRSPSAGDILTPGS